MFKKTTFKVMLVCAVIASVYSSSLAETPDPLTLVPENSVLCLRINDMNQSLANLDSYLTGVSPVPVSMAMTVSMQLTAITGDPMLTGIDKSSDFCIFVVFPEPDAVTPVMGLLVPVTSYREFVSTNPNCTAFDEKTTILSAPGSPLGAMLLKATSSDKYALVVPASEQNTLPVLENAITDSTINRLNLKLKPAQIKEAQTASLWAYVNIAELYAKYDDQLMDMLQTAQGEIQNEAPAEITEMLGGVLNVLPGLIDQVAGGADAVTLALTSQPEILTIDASFWAKDGSELSKLFVKNPDASNFTMAGYLDNDNAINGLMKLNTAASYKQMYNMFFEPIMNAMGDSQFKQSLTRFKTSLDRYYETMGKEAAISFSYSQGTPPVSFYEIVDVKDSAFMAEYMQTTMGMVNDLYQTMGVPAQVHYDPQVSTYKNATISTLSFEFSFPEVEGMAPGEVDAMIQEQMKAIYGPGGLKYYMAQTPDKFFMVMGADAENKVKTLVDMSAASTAPSGDFKTATDLFKGTPYTDAVISVNVIKLMQGLGGLMNTVMETMGEEIPSDVNPAAIFSGLENIQSKSCFAIGSYNADGYSSMRVALPKLHLAEVVVAGMQIAAEIEEMQPQMQEEFPMTLTEDNLQSWIGKEATELKMTDLDGNIYRISRLKGKTVLLDFWATWCPPCKEAIPDLIKLRSSTPETELVILGLSDEPKDLLKEFSTSAKMNYPVVSTGEELLPAPYGQISAIPTLFIIDAEGIIRDVVVGYHPLEELQAKLNSLD